MLQFERALRLEDPRPKPAYIEVKECRPATAGTETFPKRNYQLTIGAA